ncbi:metallopeptidase TldD-related protein [bacterium endosymbiont of Pedicinus badii]|uniref:metallopeptidase TldD-related protein n=1 Tax=bacterium endosymbiont of Pedicinus badii TaxID=1719126 RepID=UPI00117FF37C|nr:metallopeptidase TldD-related protein [bacterium endosymbiont of Pedicinus badii]
MHKENRIITEEDFLKKKKKVKSCVQYILEKSKKYAQFVEIYSKIKIGCTISIRFKEIENIEFHNRNYIKISIYPNIRKKGTTVIRNLDEAAIFKSIKQAYQISKYTSKDDSFYPTEKQLLIPLSKNLDIFHPKNIKISGILEILKKIENSIFSFDKKIFSTEGIQFSCFFSNTGFANYEIEKNYDSSLYTYSCSAIAKYKNSMEFSNQYSINRKFANLLNPYELGKKCAQKAVNKLNPIKICTRKTPIIFFSEISSELFRILYLSIHGRNVYKKSSFLYKSLEKKIFPNWMNIVELPHIKNGIFSFPFDSEGVSTKTIKIVHKGILKNWLLDNYSARKMHLKSNAHHNSVYNWKVFSKNISFSEILKKMYNGILITEIMGDGENITTGDYSKGCSGFLIEKGSIKNPIKEIAISGNLKNMFQNIVCISNDINYENEIQCGSVLISEMQVSGI